MDPIRKSDQPMNEHRISDEELIQKANQGDEKAKEEMCRRYRLLIKKLISVRFVQLFREDLEQYLWMVFLERMQTYRPDIARFSTMISKVLTYERWNYFTEKKKQWLHEVVHTEAEEPCAEDKREKLAWEEARNIRDTLRNRLTQEARQVFDLLLAGVKTERKIARTLGITRHQVRKRLEEIRGKGQI